MSKTTIHQKLAVLKPYLEEIKAKRAKQNKQPEWLKKALRELEEED